MSNRRICLIAAGGVFVFLATHFALLILGPFITPASTAIAARVALVVGLSTQLLFIALYAGAIYVFWKASQYPLIREMPYVRWPC